MWVRIPFIALLLLAARLLTNAAAAPMDEAIQAGALYPTPPPITNAAGFIGLSAQEANRGYPLRLEGVVTRVDPSRNLVVLQDATGALPLEFPLTNLMVQTGDRVRVTAASGIPSAAVFPEFPGHPHEREVRDAFETETDVRVYSLTRLRGFLRVPKTGSYQFWIASKGGSELWLSTNADPGLATRIASVPVGKSTNPRQWNKYPSQSSAPVQLREGDVCYLEALREQRGGRGENLAVAWLGPELPQSVIAGEYLVPWTCPGQLPVAAGDRTNGILQEAWTSFFMGAVEPLTTRGPLPSPVVLRQPRLDLLGGGALPAPLRLQPGSVLAPEDNFRWAELEGTVEFVGRDGDTLTLELVAGRQRSRVHVSNWEGQESPRLEHARLRVRGVCEAVFDAEGKLFPGIVWVPSPAEVTELETTVEEWSALKRVPLSQLSPGNPDLAWGRQIRVRGTVSRRDDGALFIEGPGSFWPYISRDGTNWEQVAPPVEVRMGENALVGLVATSFSGESLATAVFDQVEGLHGVGRQTGVHDSTPLGSASLNNSVYRLEGGGRGVGSAFDEFHFTHQPLGAGTQIVARLMSVKGDNPRAQAGIMIRENLEATSRCVALTVSPGRGGFLDVRRKDGVRGEIMELAGYTAPCWLKLVRRDFDLVAHLREGTPTRLGPDVDVTGILTWEQGRPVLRDARILEPAPLKQAPSVAATGAESGAEEMRVVPIGKFIPQEGMGLKDGTGLAQVRGVVTFFDQFEKASYLALQDESGGVFVRLTGRFASRPVRVGQLVELEIKSRNGRWPVPFDPGRISVLGWGELPEPVAHPAEYSLPLRGEGSWVELEGVVRSAAPEGMLTVMGKEDLLPVWVAGLPKNSAGGYVDARVRARGTMMRKEDGSPVLLVSSSEFVQVTEPPPREPFVIPAIPIAELKQINFNASLTHRLKVGGVVTYKDDSLLLVQDDSGGVRVQIIKPAAVALGEGIEAVGFPDSGGGFFQLTGALAKRSGATVTCEPVTQTVEELLEGNLDASLVRMKALLLEQRMRGPKQILELQSGQRMFQAVLARNDGELPVIPSGSLVELTGVCWTERLGGAVSDSGKPLVSSFQLLLRKPGDVVLLQRPPWWTWKHTVAVVGALVLVLVGASIWIHQLRRRVAERTRALEATMVRLEEETKTSATLAERNRLAAEIHDGLEQGLNGIMMQLDGVETRLKRTPEAALHHLDLARKMVRFSRTEVRHSLWDWKAPALANHDLKTALADIVSQMADGNIARVAVEVSGPSRPLPPSVEHHLLRIAQEALTNALKHAHARNITVSLDFSQDVIQLSVRDDGRGFVPDTVLNGLVGHLGLQNLRSRARQLGGELTVTSEPDRGATIAVRIPCPPDANQPS